MAVFNIFKGKSERPEDPKLEKSLEKTKESFFSRLSRALIGKSRIDSSFLDDLEEILLSSDVGIDTTLKIIERLEKRVTKDKYLNSTELNKILQEEITALLSEKENAFLQKGFADVLPKKPYVIMVVGVNGVGKTTTIGKIAWQYKNQGKKVLLGAGDTFRAAAIDQLKIWAERVDVPIIFSKHGSDPASVAFDTVQSAHTKDFDVVILDTAGRLHNKVNLMNELSKLTRVMKKIIPDAPHEIVLVLDASTGQNAIEQARQFIKSTEVNVLAVTKLDGTAKGGVVIGIVDQFKVPVKYIGLGEKKEDLELFDKEKFVQSLFHQS
jgi:fused signal recognition particle receptor